MPPKISLMMKFYNPKDRKKILQVSRRQNKIKQNKTGHIQKESGTGMTLAMSTETTEARR